MISVIIPCYKASSTLNKCVRSVLRQTYSDVEVILVDDGSPDRTLDTCLSLQSRDSRVRVVKQEKNLGVDAARFRGIDEAKGEYLMFIDADDWLNGHDTLQQMYEHAQKTGADVVMAGMRRVLDKACLFKGNSDVSEEFTLSTPTLFEDYYISFFGVNRLSVSMCAKLYRRDTVMKANIKPSGLRMGEDLHFNMMLFPHLQRFSTLPIIAYNYRFGGVTSGYNKRLFDDMLCLYKIKKGLIEKYEYHKASDFIIIEMVNVLRSEICQCIRFVKDPGQVRNRVDQLLTLDIWDDIDTVSEHPQWLQKPFSKAIKERDAATILDLCNEIERKNRLSFYAKRVMSKILSVM